ncbi:type II secretion system F family protein [Streptomyces sp. NPDC014894]|uniref:type II secretion system F family protein n=1 Tax=Streptomyces sp. NPDC014894 TaxID=3364931 RepID=UPI0037032A58
MTGEAAPGPTAAVALAAVLLLGLAVAALRDGRRARGRGEALLGVARARRRWRPEPGARLRIWGPPLVALAAGWFLVEGALGLGAGLAAGWAVRRWRPGTRAPAPEADRRLPLAADLLAACLSAGAGPREAAEAVGEALGGPVGERLSQAAAELRLGGEPGRAWASFARLPGAAELARCLERAGTTGAPAGEPVSRLASRLRADRARAAGARGRRAQVLITAPVGLCFLPAFLAVGVAPVVIGLAEGLLHGE